MTSADLKKAIKAGKSKATLKTVSGGTLTAMMKGPKTIELKDEKGGISTVATADVMQSNGVIHVIDTVLMPYIWANPLEKIKPRWRKASGVFCCVLGPHYWQLCS